MTTPKLYYVGDDAVGVCSECLCPAPAPRGLARFWPEHPHEAHDIVPVRFEEDLPEGVNFADYKRWCRLFAAAPDLQAALTDLLERTLVVEENHVGEVDPPLFAPGLLTAARAALAKAEGR